MKFCYKSLSETSYLFRKQLINSFSFNRQQFLDSFESTTLYFKETTLDDINPATKKEKKLTFRHITKTLSNQTAVRQSAPIIPESIFPFESSNLKKSFGGKQKENQLQEW